MKQIPTEITPRILADAIDVTRKVAQRMLNREGILRRRGTRTFARESDIRERMPDEYARLYQHIVLDISEEP